MGQKKSSNADSEKTINRFWGPKQAQIGVLCTILIPVTKFMHVLLRTCTSHVESNNSALAMSPASDPIKHMKQKGISIMGSPISLIIMLWQS